MITSLPLISVVYILFSRSSLGQLIDNKITENMERTQQNHIKGNRLRKQFSIDVQEILQDLAEHTGANRVIIFEFSNGTTNLIGLPFLFITAAAEVATPGLSLIGQRHQRLNTSTIASFLIKLEKEGSIFIDMNKQIPEEYEVLEQLMRRANIQSALFYSIQGIDEAIGFIVLVTHGNSQIHLNTLVAYNLMNKSVQKISSMINFEEIEERGKKKK